MRQLLFLSCLPVAAFSSVMHIAPEMAGVTYTTPDNTGESSWYSSWVNSLTTTKTSDLGITSQNAATLSKATLADSLPLSNGTSTADAAPAAVVSNPEPGTWGLLTLGFAAGFFMLSRRKIKQ